MRRFLMLIPALFFLTACPVGKTDPWQTAHNVVNVVRVGVGMANTGFVTAEQVTKKGCESKCIQEDPTKGEKYKTCMTTCMKKMNDALAIWAKVDPLAQSVCNQADATIRLAKAFSLAKGDPKACATLDPTKGEVYQKCLKGEPIKKADWQAVFKTGACTIYRGLVMIPKEYEKYVASLKAILKSYGQCK